MKITNKLGLPEPFVQMAQRDYAYQDKRYSVTSLLKGLREVMLERRHADEIETDVSDCIWMLFGTAVHSVLENQQETDTQLKENSIKTVIDGYTISGRFDLYDAKTKTITDYKTCSVWKIIHGDYKDWRQQLLIYAYIMREYGFEVTHGEIVAVMRDHSMGKAKFDSSYPDMQVKVIKFHFTEYDFGQMRYWLQDKVRDIKIYEQLEDNALPPCTPEERYNTGDKFAVMKKGKKRAMRVLDTYEEAATYREENDGDYIEPRPGEDRKCLEYCNCSKFCNFYQSHCGGKE